ncbi:MAG: ABC transporter substrate-binding protein [Lachnospiraceae bacterium]|nr:ABC transporter substrate-binding protein [Lachnospiraceae bacterium]
MKKKLISALLCVSMIATMLVGCGDNGSSSSGSSDAGATSDTQESDDGAADEGGSASAEGGKVYYLNFKPEVDDQWQEIAAAYTAETGVEVKVVTAASGEYETTLKSEIAKTDAPTLFQINGPVGYQSWKDYCLDLSDTDVYDALSDKSLAVTDGDGVYGVPYTIEGYGIIYNDAIMQAYFALDGAVATSMDEINNFAKLKEVVEDMTAKKDDLGIEGVFASTSLLPGEDWRWQTHLLNYPINFEFADAGVTDLDEITFSYGDNFKDIFDLYINNSCVAPALLGNKSVTDSMAEFALGQVAMVQNGNWAWTQISDTEGNVVKEEDVKFLPIYCGVDGEENNGLAIGTENFWAINSQASDADIQATKDFISWMISSDAGKDYMVNSLGNTAPFTTFADDEKPQDPLAVSMLSSMESGKTAVPWAFTSFPSEQYKTDIGDALLQYSGGSMTWDEVVDTVITRWSEEKAASAAE